MFEQETRGGSFHSDESIGPNKRKRKQMSPSSDVWEQYTQMEDDPNKALCNYCSDVLSCRLKKNGTSSLVTHAKWCTHKSGSNQTRYSTDPNSLFGTSTVYPWKYNAHEARMALARLVIEDELPLAHSQHPGFSQFMSQVCTRFSAPPRKIVCKDVARICEEEKAKLKNFFQESRQSVASP
jgi:hypothetical protein